MPMFFATIAFACQVRWASRAGRLRWLFAAGFFLGVAFWGGYQAAALVAPAALAHALLCARMRPAAQAFRCFWGGGLLYVAGFLLAMGLAEATSYPLILLFRSQGLGYPHPTFWEVNFPRWMYHGSQPAHLSGLLVLPYFLGLYEGYGALCALLFLAGMGAWAWSRHGAPALRSGRADGYVLFALVALPGIVAYATFAVKGVLVVRAYLYALPFFVTAIAALTMAAWESPSPMRAASRIVIATGLALAAISSSFGIREVLQMRSGYPSVAAYCMEIGARPAPGPDSLILECYLRAAAASSPPDGAMELAAYDLSELCVSLYPDEVAARRRASAFRKEFRQSVGRLLVETEGIEFYGDPLPALLRAHRLDRVRASRIMTYQMFPAEELRGDSFGGTP